MKNSRLLSRRAINTLFISVWFVFGSPVAQSDNVDGAWTAVEDWPLIAIHAAVTPDGRVLSYGTDGTGKQTGYFVYDIWDPSAGLAGGHMTLNNMTLTDIFCSSQIILPQSGEILIAGGDNWTGTGTTNTGNNNSNIFDYGDNTLARSANMNRSRWYSSSTALVDGEVYIQGGSGGHDRPEVRQLDGAFRLLSNASTNSYATLFPRNFLAPDGRVFGYDTSGKMYFVDAAGAGSLISAGQFSSSYVGWTSGAAMFSPGKILQIGGNSSGAVVIDINGPEPVVTPTDSLSSRRHWVSATVLANGRVLATGGSSSANQLTGVNNRAEIWDPATGQWHVGSEAALARLYHSSALLLPDASVLVAGGGAPGPLNNTNAEIYYPPYLYDSNGGFAPRPQILSAPDTANVGDRLTIQVDSSTISRVTLVKSGSVTHSVNMDQRFLDLPFTASGNMLEASLPDRASDTPPGFYLMFIINSEGVPSVSSMLRINIDSTPNTAVDYTPAIGGGGGGPFKLECNSDEILVGAHGKYATYVNQIGPQCLKMDQFGRWIGDPINRPVTGTTGTGTSFSKTCPRDHAMSGFQGRSGQYVNQIDIECRALTPDGDLTGNGQLLGAAGGSGGSVQALLRCGTDNPAYALYGRSGGWLDSFGVQCRQGFVTTISVNSDPVIVNPGAQSGIVGMPVNLQISASDGDGDDLTFASTGLPPGLAINAGNGLISGVPASAGLYDVEVTVTDGTLFDSASFAWTIDSVAPLSVDPMPPQSPKPVNIAVDYTANSSGGINVVYKWDFGDGTPETAYSSSPSVSHTYSEPGIRYVTLTVDDDVGGPDIQTFVQGVHLPHTAERPNSSTNIVFEDRDVGNSRVWVVNQDNDSVSVFDASTNAIIAEIPVGQAPRSIAIAPDQRVWVANKRSGDITIVDPVSLAVSQTLAMPFASQPYGIVFSPVANEAYIVLEAAGRVLKLDALTGVQLASSDAIASPRHLAINAAGDTVYVSRFITSHQTGEETAVVETQIGGADTGGEIIVIETASMTVLQSIVLRHSDMPDAENQGRGVPNYLGAMAISPDGASARVPSKQDNIARGELRDPGQNLNFQNTVRAISSRVDMATNVEDYARRIDYDNSSVSSAALFDPSGIYAFVALETSREVAIVDAYAFEELFRINVGRAPQGLAISPDGLRLYVNNFLDRSVDVFDLTTLQTLGQWSVPTLATLPTVSAEALDPQVLRGKQLFYDALDTRLALDRYLSCASCHNDGSHDGRTWDLTGLDEGLRNTIDLRGHARNQGRKHWTGNFDEVHDFELQIRVLSGGTGLMDNADFFSGTRNEPLGDPKAGISEDLDALAAYVESLDTFDVSPYRDSDGTLTFEAEAGRQVFQDQGCASCHGDPDFSNSDSDTLHDIGTIKPSSGKRLAGDITGFDTPTLRGVWSSAPYLHDGSAATLADAVLAHDGVTLVDPELSQLVAYLQQIDALEGTAQAGLVAYWPMNEGTGGSTADMSGNGHTGTLANGTQWSPDQGLAFDGENDYVEVGTFDVAGSSLTLAAWVRSDQLDNCRTYNDCRVISKATSTSSQDHYFMLSTIRQGSATRLRFRLKTDGTTSTLYASSGDMVVDQWMHVAAVYDGAFMRLYLDGVEVGAIAKTGALSTNSSVPVWIGSNPTNPTKVPWDGQIDEVRVYSRALTTEELAQLAGGNVAPSANDQSIQLPEDSTQAIVLTADDGDGDPLAYSIVSGPANGSLSGTAPSVSYVPAADFFGNDSFNFQVTDNRGGVDTATVAITVQAANDGPIATGESFGLVEDNVLNVSAPGVLGNDSDVDGDALSAALQSGPSAGSLTLNQDGSFSYTPNSGYVGTDSFSYAASDGQILSAAVSVQLTIEAFVAPNTPPVAVDQSIDVVEDTVISISLVATDLDGDPLTYSIVSGASNGTISGSAPNLTYTPNTDFNGADAFAFRANDGEANSNTATISINVTPANDSPVATAAAISTEEDTAVDIELQASDLDGDSLNYAVVTGPTDGSLSGSAPFLIYTPNAGYTGDDGFEFQVSDGNGGIDSATVTITVNSPPSGLVAYWPMNEGTGGSTADMSGNGHTGTLANGTQWSADQGLAFDGENDYVDVGTFDVAGSSLTLAAWVRSDQLDNCRTYNDCRVISKATSTSSQDHYFMLSTIRQGSATRLRFRLKTDGTTSTLYASSGDMVVDQWMHVAAVYDGAFMRLYLDGVEVGAIAKTGALSTNSSVPVWIGSNPTNPTQVPWDGQIDEVRVYNRALTAQELFDLAQDTR